MTVPLWLNSWPFWNGRNLLDVYIKRFHIACPPPPPPPPPFQTLWTLKMRYKKTNLMLIVDLKVNEEWPSWARAKFRKFAKRSKKNLRFWRDVNISGTFSLPVWNITIWTLSLYQATDVGQIEQFIGLFTKFHGRNEHRLSIWNWKNPTVNYGGKHQQSAWSSLLYSLLTFCKLILSR